jgi:hypothetical protein
MKKYGSFLDGELLDLKNEIALLSPTDTPLYTMLAGRGAIVPAADITVSWREKELNAVRGTLKLEGAEAGTEIQSTRTMKTNINQILEKVVSVSGTVRALAAKGLGDEFIAEVNDRLIEMKRDAEYYFLNGTYALEAGATPRQMNGLLNLVANVEDVSDDAVAGQLTENTFLDAMQKVWTAGAQGEYVAFLNAGEKRIVNALLKDSNSSRIIANAGENKLGIKVTQFDTDFGIINLVLNRWMPTGQILGVDMDYVEIAELRSPFYEDLAKTGDYSKGHVVAEQTIKLLNSKAGFKIVGITK